MLFDNRNDANNQLANVLKEAMSWEINSKGKIK